MRFMQLSTPVRGLVYALVGFLPAFSYSLLAQRIYWKVSIDTLAAGKNIHTHVQVTGRVSLVKTEADGDTHIRLTAPSGSFIVAECIPQLPCSKPAVGQTITVRGISRRDLDHGWYEVHPVELLTFSR